jgi:hypothetical protein
LARQSFSQPTYRLHPRPPPCRSLPLSPLRGRTVRCIITRPAIAGIRAAPACNTIRGTSISAKLASGIFRTNIRRCNEKGEPNGSPFSILLCRLGSDANRASVFGRRAPRERCVQLWFSSKPGGVMSPPKLDELTPNDYSSDLWNASEELKNPQRCGFRKLGRNIVLPMSTGRSVGSERAT